MESATIVCLFREGGSCRGFELLGFGAGLRKGVFGEVCLSRVLCVCTVGMRRWRLRVDKKSIGCLQNLRCAVQVFGNKSIELVEIVWRWVTKMTLILGQN